MLSCSYSNTDRHPAIMSNLRSPTTSWTLSGVGDLSWSSSTARSCATRLKLGTFVMPVPPPGSIRGDSSNCTESSSMLSRSGGGARSTTGYELVSPPPPPGGEPCAGPPAATSSSSSRSARSSSYSFSFEIRIHSASRSSSSSPPPPPAVVRLSVTFGWCNAAGRPSASASASPRADGVSAGAAASSSGASLGVASSSVLGVICAALSSGSR